MGPLGPSSTSLASQTAAPRAESYGTFSAGRKGRALPCQRRASREAGGSAARSELGKAAEPCLLLLPASPSVAKSTEGTAWPRSILLGREGRSPPPLQLQGQRKLDQQRLLPARQLPARDPRAAGPPPRWKGRADEGNQEVLSETTGKFRSNGRKCALRQRARAVLWKTLVWQEVIQDKQGAAFWGRLADRQDG